MNFKYNNLDWLRLIFAFQVMIYHFFVHFNDSIVPNFLNFINYIPGVPAFFFVSGFLIYASCINTNDNSIYFKNRFLRLFPGLLFVSFGSLALIIFAHWNNNLLENIPTYFFWFLAQITIGQAYNPNLFQDIGIGVINGALWTITVEILFYIMVPIIVFIEKRFTNIVYLLFILSFLFYSFGSELLSGYQLSNKDLYRYFELTPFVWGWMFCFGIICFKKIELISKYIKYFYLSIIPLVYIASLNIESSIFFTPFSNRLGLIYFIFLSLIILYLSFETKVIKLKVDLSYSVYIWHLLIVNLLLELNNKNILLAIFMVTLISFISWYLVEKPFLKRKRKSIRA